MPFGRKHFGKPTPAKVGFTVTLISVIAAAVQSWVMTADFIPSYWAKIISGVLGLIILVSNAIKPFFGVAIDTKTVPADRVTEIETKPDK